MEGIEKESVRRYVPENDPAFVEESERKVYRSKEGFGESVLRMHEYAESQAARNHERLARLDEDSDEAGAIREEIKANTEGAKSSIKGDFLRLAYSIDSYNQSSGDGDADFIRQELAEILLDNDEIDKELRAHFGSELKDLNIPNLVEKIRADELSMDFILAVAKKRGEQFAVQSEAFDGYTEKLKEDFKRKAQLAVEEGTLPQSVLANLDRVDSLEIKLSDAFQHSGNLGENCGNNYIRINSLQFRPGQLPGIRKTVFHEILHTTDGTSVIGRTNEHGEQFYERKGGLQIQPTDGWSLAKRNRWINEAVTEKIAILLSGYDDSDSEQAYAGSSSYVRERKILDGLIADGLDESLIYKAYFENITSDQPAGERGKHFGELVRAINGIEGEYAFSRLENEDIAAEMFERLAHGNFYKLTDKTAEELSWDTRSKFFTVHFTVGKNSKAQTDFSMTYAMRLTEDNADEFSSMSDDDWRDKINKEIQRSFFPNDFWSERSTVEISENV